MPNDKILHDFSDLNKKDLKAVKTKAKNTAQDLKGRAKELLALSHEYYDYAHDEFEDVSQKLKNRIEAEPVKAAAYAFVAGYLLRALLKR